jgi:hypothetical protein
LSPKRVSFTPTKTPPPNKKKKKTPTHVLLGMARHSYLMVRNTQNSGWCVASRQHEWMKWNEMEWTVLKSNGLFWGGAQKWFWLIINNNSQETMRTSNAKGRVHICIKEAHVVFLLFFQYLSTLMGRLHAP